MSKLNIEKLCDLLYYNKLPEVYRDLDSKQKPKYPLYRFLKSAIIDGGGIIVQDIENLSSLIDPETCPEDLLPYLLKCFGLPYFEDIPIIYQRKLVSSIGELIKRRGTYSCVRYLARVLTNMEVKIERIDLDGDIRLKVILIAESINDIINLDVSIKVVQRYLNYFIPFWLQPVFIESEIIPQKIQTMLYTVPYTGFGYNYSLVPKVLKNKTYYHSCFNTYTAKYKIIPKEII